VVDNKPTVEELQLDNKQVVLEQEPVVVLELEQFVVVGVDRIFLNLFYIIFFFF